MSIAEAATPRTMTVEEFLALPEDGVSRELIRGEVRERGMTIRNRFHSRVEANIAKLLGVWLETRPEPRGQIVSGEAGFRLRGTPDSAVGIDVAYASAELVAATGDRQLIFDGPPVLAVEILSPSDQHEDIVEKVRLYHESGTLVWVVDPDFRTVTVHRPGQLPVAFNEGQELDGGPELPGFHVPVARFFGG
jgi:Uma2 family endonuclease